MCLHHVLASPSRPAPPVCVLRCAGNTRFQGITVDLLEALSKGIPAFRKGSKDPGPSQSVALASPSLPPARTAACGFRAPRGFVLCFFVQSHLWLFPSGLFKWWLGQGCSHVPSNLACIPNRDAPILPSFKPPIYPQPPAYPKPRSVCRHYKTMSVNLYHIRQR